MTGLEAREALLDCAERDGDIAEGALWIAAEDLAGVEPPRWLGRIEELAAELTVRCGIDGCGPQDAPLVAALLRDRLRLRRAGGGDPTYATPDQQGFSHRPPPPQPVTIETDAGAYRFDGVPEGTWTVTFASPGFLAIPVEGVNMPGHFLVRVEGHLFDTVAADEPLDDADMRRLVATSTGSEPAAIAASWLVRASTREMLARMSRNLRRCYTSLENWPLALQAAERCVALLPDAAAERRDRGLLLWRIGKISASLRDITSYLECAPPDSADRASLAELAGRLRAFLN